MRNRTKVGPQELKKQETCVLLIVHNLNEIKSDVRG